MDRFGRSSSMESCTQEENTINEELIEYTVEEIITEDTMNEEKKNQRNVEKRGREDSDEIIEEDDSFTTVTKKAKRLLRSNSNNNNSRENECICENNLQESNFFEVCLTSKTMLPKMVGMAKLLKSQNINNILKIKYKSPYRMFITLKYIEDANKILDCEKFQELDFRCQRTDQLSMIYGIVRNIDLEIEEKELAEIFKSEVDIYSVKRLKRLTEDGQWVDSEAIKIAFKGATLPSYIYGYECRFRVESYIFPVTQCSGCWKYGHMKRFCPTQKIICPKCGKGHENCETEKFSCINCKGPHMALNKSCPVYLKEKMIRDIMSKDKCSYKIALESYLKQFKKSNDIPRVSVEAGKPRQSSTFASQKRTYKDALIPLEPTINLISTCMDSSVSIEEASESEEGSEKGTAPKSIKKKNKKKKQKENNKEQSKGSTELPSQQEKKKEKTIEEISNKGENTTILWKLYNKVKDIVLDECSLEQKMKKIIKLLLEEIVVYVVSYFKDWEIVSNLFKSIIIDG